jgi:protein involved in sex pheromone biosynthesis
MSDTREIPDCDADLREFGRPVSETYKSRLRERADRVFEVGIELAIDRRARREAAHAAMVDRFVTQVCVRGREQLRANAAAKAGEKKR